MRGKKTCYIDLEVGDFLYANEEKETVIKRYFFGMKKKEIPKQSKYKVLEIAGIDSLGYRIALNHPYSKPAFLRFGLKNLDTGDVRYIHTTSYKRLAKKRK